MSAAEFLDDYFENDLIKAAMASPGIIGTALGVYSPGSAYILLHHVMGDVDGNIGSWGLPRGGMGAISKAIGSAMQSFGGEIRTNATVQQLLVKNGKASGAAGLIALGFSSRQLKLCSKPLFPAKLTQICFESHDFDSPNAQWQGNDETKPNHPD